MQSLTDILTDIHLGNQNAVNQLFGLVYDELRHLANAKMASEHPNHPLQPTGLVHEVFLRVAADPAYQFTSRQHFFAAAAQAMRRILVDHARTNKAEKRGGRVVFERLQDAPMTSGENFWDLISLNDALRELEQEDARKVRLVELRYFVGLSLAEAAEGLDISLATAKRDWAYAKAWLYDRLNHEQENSDLGEP